MKKLKSTVALLLCGLMAFTFAACANGDGDSPTDGASGRYVEKDITPPGAEGKGLETFLNTDGTLVCYDQGFKTRYESADGGENWTESEGPGVSNPKLENTWNCALLPDGSLLAAVVNEEMTGLEALLKVLPDGSTEPFSIPVLDEALAAGKDPYISILKPLSADRLFLSYSAGGNAMSLGDEPEEDDQQDETNAPATEGNPVAATGDEGEEKDAEEGEPEDEGEEEGRRNFNYSDSMEYFSGLIDLATGEVVADQSEWMGTGVEAIDDTYYLMDYDGEIQAKNLADGSSKSGADMKVPVGEFAFSLTMATAPDGSFYVLDGKKVQKIAPGGQPETVLDGSSYSFAGGGGMARDLMLLEDGSMVMHLQREGGNKLYRYTWDANAKVDPAKSLKVWSLKEDSRLRTAINTLRSKNPDVTVEYEVAIGDDGSITPEDAIKNLNTRMLNGDGPDVMILDGTPVESYAAKGLLMDLAGQVDTSGMFDAVKAPFETENGTFYLPTGFKVPLLLGSADNLANVDSLEALAKKVTEGNALLPMSNVEDVFAQLPEEKRPVLAPQDLREMFDILWNSSSGGIVTADGLDSAATEAFLSALKAISEKYGLGEDGGGAASGAMAVMSSDGAAATVQGSVLAYSSQRALLGSYLSDDIQMLDHMTGPAGTEFVSFPGLKEGAWQPASLVGVNADTEKAELAVELVKTMLGDEVQGTRSGAGYPVTAGGMEKQIAYLNDILTENTGEGFTFDYEPLVALLKQPNLSEDVVTGMVWPVAESLCKGEVDLEGAVKQIEQDLKNYLAERQ